MTAVKTSVRVGQLVHGFDDPEHKEAGREIMREVQEMEDALEWIIAPDRPMGSDAEMVYVMEQTARKILNANDQVHTSATGGADSAQVEGCSDQPKSDSERVADCGATPCSISSFRGWLRCGLWRNLIWILPLMLGAGLLAGCILILLRQMGWID